MLVLSFSPVASDARVLKQVRHLSAELDVVTCGYGPAPEGVTAHVRIPDEVRNDLDGRLITLHAYRAAYFAQAGVRWVRGQVAAGTADVIVANDAERALLTGVGFDVTTKIADLTADFEQQKFTAMLKKPLISSGAVAVRGSAMLWKTRKPEPSELQIDQKEVRIYYPAQETIEVYQVEQKLGQLAASPLPRRRRRPRCS